MSGGLATFLRARLDEVQQAAQAAMGDWERDSGEMEAVTGATFRHLTKHSPARELAQVEATRRLIELADEASGLDDSVDLERRVSPRDSATEPYLGETMLRAMATVYAGHPDYREEWR